MLKTKAKERLHVHGYVFISFLSVSPLILIFISSSFFFFSETDFYNNLYTSTHPHNSNCINKHVVVVNHWLPVNQSYTLITFLLSWWRGHVTAVRIKLAEIHVSGEQQQTQNALFVWVTTTRPWTIVRKIQTVWRQRCGFVWVTSAFSNSPGCNQHCVGLSAEGIVMCSFYSVL